MEFLELKLPPMGTLCHIEATSNGFDIGESQTQEFYNRLKLIVSFEV